MSRATTWCHPARTDRIRKAPTVSLIAPAAWAKRLGGATSEAPQSSARVTRARPNRCGSAYGVGRVVLRSTRPAAAGAGHLCWMGIDARLAALSLKPAGIVVGDVRGVSCRTPGCPLVGFDDPASGHRPAVRSRGRPSEAL